MRNQNANRTSDGPHKINSGASIDPDRIFSDDVEVYLEILPVDTPVLAKSQDLSGMSAHIGHGFLRSRRVFYRWLQV
jgi:hypothetical protein